jgi:hypothetical protein
VKKGWEYTFRHKISDDEIAVRRAEISAEAGASLAESSIPVGQLALSAEESRQRHRAAVKRVLRSQLELFARSDWLIIIQTRGGAVVRNYPEEALTLWLWWSLRIAACRSDARLSCIRGEARLTIRQRPPQQAGGTRKQDAMDDHKQTLLSLFNCSVSNE